MNVILTRLKGGTGSGNHGHSGRPGKVGGSSGGGVVGGHTGAGDDVPAGGMVHSPQDMLNVTKRGLKKMADNVNQWSVRDSVMRMANKYLGTDLLALGGKEGQATAKRLLADLSTLPNSELMNLFDDFYQDLE